MEKTPSATLSFGRNHKMDRWRLLAATAFFIALAMNRFALSYSIVIQQTEEKDSFINDSSSFHILQGASALGMILGSIPIHYCHQANTSVLVLVYGLISGVATLLFPLAFRFGLVVSAISRFINGIGIAAQPFLSNDYVLKWSKKDKESETLAIILAAYPIAAILCSILFFFYEALGGWRNLYYILSVYCLICTMAFALITFKRNTICPENSETSLASQSKQESSLKHLKNNRNLVVTLILYCGMYYGFGLYALYSSLITKTTTGLSDDWVMLIQIPAVVLDVVVRLILGKISDKGSIMGRKFDLLSIIQIVYIVSILSFSTATLAGFINRPILLLVGFSFFGIFQASLFQLFGRLVQLDSPAFSNMFFNLTVTLSGIFDVLLPVTLLGIESILTFWRFSALQMYASECGYFLTVTVGCFLIMKLFVRLDFQDNLGEEYKMKSPDRKSSDRQ